MKALKNRSKMIFTMLFLLVFTMGVLSACSKSGNEEKNVPINKLKEKVSTITDVSKMKEGDEKKLKKLYKIDTNDVEEFILYTASSNIKADEIAIIKVKDSNKVEDIKNKITKRIEKQSASFKEYLPKEYSLIEKHVLKNNGKYIIMIISNDAEKIEKAIDESFK